MGTQGGRALEAGEEGEHREPYGESAELSCHTELSCLHRWETASGRNDDVPDRTARRGSNAYTCRVHDCDGNVVRTNCAIHDQSASWAHCRLGPLQSSTLQVEGPDQDTELDCSCGGSRARWERSPSTGDDDSTDDG
jgi:hypothetical protein